MKLQNVPKNCSYKNINFYFVTAVVASCISYLSRTNDKIVHFFNNGQTAELVMAKILPALFFALLVIYIFNLIKKRQTLKQPNNIKEVKIEKSGIEFNFYDPSKNFSITEDKLLGLEMIIKVCERLTENDNQNHLDPFSSKYKKETEIDEIKFIFTLSDEQKFELLNAPLIPMDVIYKIFENFNNIHKIQYSFNGKGKTKKIEEDIEYFYQNKTRRLLINELKNILIPILTIVFSMLLLTALYFGL